MTRGSKTPVAPVEVQKVSALTVESGRPVTLSWMRKLELVCVKTLSSPTAPIVSGGMVKMVVPMRGPSSCARKLCEGLGEGTFGCEISLLAKPPPAVGISLVPRDMGAGGSGRLPGEGIDCRCCCTGPLWAGLRAHSSDICRKLTLVASTSGSGEDVTCPRS